MKKIISRLSYALPITLQVWHIISPFILAILTVEALLKKKKFHFSQTIHLYAAFLLIINILIAVLHSDVERFSYIFKTSPLIVLPLIFSVRCFGDNLNDYWKAFIVGSVILSIIVVPQFLSGIEMYVHRPYFGFFLSLSLLWSFFFYKQGEKKKWYLAFILFFLITMLIVVPRLALVNSMTIVLYFFLSGKKEFLRSIYLKISLAAVFLVVLTNFSTLKSRFFDTIEKDPRLIIWECFYEVTQKEDFNHLFGYSSEKRSQQVLRKTYYDHRHDKVNYFWAFDKNYNTHNQFFDFYLSWGTLGLILFIFPFIILFIWTFKKRDPFSFFTIFVLFTFCIVENPLRRSWTIVAYPLCFELIRYRLLTLKTSNGEAD